MKVKVTRRGFLRGAILFALNWVACRVAPPLNRARRATLEAVLKRLIPADNTIAYVERALEHRVNARKRAPVREFCDQVEEVARTEWGRDFVALPPEDQDAVLRFMQGKNAAFDDVLELALEGFLGGPGPGWKFIGWESKRCG